MFSLSSFGLAFLALGGVVSSASIPYNSPVSRNGLARRQGCTHGPDDRGCWSDGFDIDTDVYESWPNTGRVVEKTLTVTNVTCNPDGGPAKFCQLINGQYPGPTIEANWGDTLRITVVNKLRINGTSFHWHGIRQLGSNEQDGVNGVTECPIAPNEQKVYEFQATQYGTSWYHSHHSNQYGEGVVGTMIINGPATANYDEDLGVLPLTDWYYKPVFELLWSAMRVAGGPPPSQNVLVNGTMVDGNGKGKYQKLNVQKGKTYRLRFVNTAVDHLFHVSMDGHPFTVIGVDFVSVKPYNTSDLAIAIGQRYDVVFTADKDVGNYWLRVNSGGGACGQAAIYGGAPNNPATVVGGILSYEGAPTANPNSTGITTNVTCIDETFSPHKVIPVPSDTFAAVVEQLSVGITPANSPIVNWLITGAGLNASSMNVDWEKPTLDYVRDQNSSFPTELNVIELPSINQWAFWVIRSAIPVPHPIHVHGHDFWIIGTGTSAATIPTGPGGLDFTNPMRRDVATLPAGGWLLLAFPTDNPGAWLMHCLTKGTHIAWHASQGLSLQFLERKDEIISSIGDLEGEYDRTCASWKDYWNMPSREGVDEDSGLRQINNPPVPGKQRIGGGVKV
ncbi:multicopper oxidase [Aulographum hederae CBS 113979]|uniref:laccase n=1 Tax=Aulographum hederae CBS 113979 TaxID=1176131 RepID=A0A6G1GVF2_9PEZI|nr:multicopper oxidase [Aulographum hederae CBS 113979]